MFNKYRYKLNIIYFCVVVVNHCYEKVLLQKKFVYLLVRLFENALLLESAFSFLRLLLNKISFSSWSHAMLV